MLFVNVLYLFVLLSACVYCLSLRIAILNAWQGILGHTEDKILKFIFFYVNEQEFLWGRNIT